MLAAFLIYPITLWREQPLGARREEVLLLCRGATSWYSLQGWGSLLRGRAANSRRAQLNTVIMGFCCRCLHRLDRNRAILLLFSKQNAASYINNQVGRIRKNKLSISNGILLICTKAKYAINFSFTLNHWEISNKHYAFCFHLFGLESVLDNKTQWWKATKGD